MKRLFLIAGMLAVLIVLAVYFSLRGKEGTNEALAQNTEASAPPSLTPASTATQAAVPAPTVPNVPGTQLTIKDKEKLGKILTVFGTRIDFFGKVIDQTGQAIPGANVYCSATDRYFGEGSKYEAVSDSNGLFSISGIKGAGLYVEVSKDGYERIPNGSYGSFGYGVSTAKPPPTKDSPAVLVLRKKGATEPLVVVSSRQYEAPKDGTPVGINLKNARKTYLGQADIAIQTWVNDQTKDEHNRFDWKCRISVPNGGLLERKDASTFEAPEGGYQESDEINMAQLDDAWRRDVPRDYFVRLADGTYAHLKIDLMIGGNFNFFVLESHLNPSGSRNLEFDPAKEIKPK